jgi:phage repressor protein C with HTH and peptisase S24 domain
MSDRISVDMQQDFWHSQNYPAGMSIPERLRAARVAAGFKSASQAAERFGWKRSTYASHENGQTPTPPIEALEDYARAFRVPMAHLVDGSQPANGRKAQGFDVMGVVGAGERVETPPDEERHPIDYIDPPSVKDGYVAVEVRGDSMTPVYQNGDYLFIRRNISWSIGQLIGRDCVVETERGRTYVKCVKRGSKAGHVDLISYQEGVEPFLDVVLKWGAPVEWIMRK